MEKPNKPYPPSPFEFGKVVERKYIFSCTESLREEEFEEDEDEDEDEAPDPDEPQDTSDITLEQLMARVPVGLKLSQIKMEFDYNASCMSYDDHYVKFYYEVTKPPRNKEYKAAQEQFKKDMEQYEKDIVVYEQYRKEQKIKKTEEKLARLRGQ